MRTSWERLPGEDIREWHRRCMDAEHSLPFWLYRQYDEAGTLLYVGMTEEPARRTRAHRSSAWFHLVHRIGWQLHPNHASALAAERHAIRSEGPLYNVTHSPDTAAALARRRGLAA